jgi:hypothetical protein
MPLSALRFHMVRNVNAEIHVAFQWPRLEQMRLQKVPSSPRSSDSGSSIGERLARSMPPFSIPMMIIECG